MWELMDMDGDVLATGTEKEMRDKAASIVGNRVTSHPHYSTWLYGPGDGSTSLMVRWLDIEIVAKGDDLVCGECGATNSNCMECSARGSLNRCDDCCAVSDDYHGG